MPLASLRDLFVDELRNLYSGEAQLLKALPGMARASDAPELRVSFEKHVAVTREQVERLDRVFEAIGVKAKGKRYEAMAGLVAEARGAMTRQAHPAVRDAALIGAARRVEHHEMAGYGCVRDYARLLGDEESADLLQDSLDEAAEADARLTELAQTAILYEADEAARPRPRVKPPGRNAARTKKARRAAR